MELIAAILIAGPLGYRFPGRTRARGIAAYLALWAVIFPIQTAVVTHENPDDLVVMYFVVNAVILALGITLNRFGARTGVRRRAGASVATSATS